jgi:tetrahydromethanopterin S-methyltransferase subunit A
MAKTNLLDKIRSELREGMELPKCRQCGCMKESLERLQRSLSSLKRKASSGFHADIAHWLAQMKPIQYGCLSCDYCFPAVATNVFHQAFPEVAQPQTPSCAFEVTEGSWPPVAGEYHVFCEGPSCPVAVSTLASVDLAERLARVRPKELCIVGKTETENIGIDKIIKNTVTNPTIRFLLLAGEDPKGHQSGRTLLALWENGVDENMKVVGSPGRRPVLKNVTREEVEAFRKQVQIVDRIGCEEEQRIVEELKDLSQRLDLSCSHEETAEAIEPVRISEVPIIHAEQPTKVEMDKAGYFVILPQPDKQIIVVEHYSYDNTLQRVIDGKDARSIYGTIIKNGWVTQLSHAAYLGKELAKAEFSIKMGLQYVQDGA